MSVEAVLWFGVTGILAALVLAAGIMDMYVMHLRFTQHLRIDPPIPPSGG